jgi:hypothetical protein
MPRATSPLLALTALTLALAARAVAGAEPARTTYLECNGVQLTRVGSPVVETRRQTTYTFRLDEHANTVERLVKETGAFLDTCRLGKGECKVKFDPSTISVIAKPQDRGTISTGTVSMLVFNRQTGDLGHSTIDRSATPLESSLFKGKCEPTTAPKG